MPHASDGDGADRDDTSTARSHIEHVVVLMLENRGFDTALGYLYTRDSPPAQTLSRGNGPPFDGPDFGVLPTQLPFVLKGSEVTGQARPSVRAANSPGSDPGEPYHNTLQQVFGAKDREPPVGTAPTMNGFLRDYGEEIVDRPWLLSIDSNNVLDILRLFSPADLPVLNTLARGFATCDAWFSSVPTQTNANRAYSVCGTSLGLVDNGFYPAGFITGLLQNDAFDTRTIWNVLSDNGLGATSDWMVYYNATYPHDVPTAKPYSWNAFPRVQRIDGAWDHFALIDRFFAQARAGALPRFSYIEPKWGGELVVANKRIAYLDGNEYHPPQDITHSEVMLKTIYDALRSNPEAWSKTLLLVVFDEHGGTYDHVPPPWGASPPWGATPPAFERQYGFEFNRFGVRIPALLVTPWVEARTVFRSPTSVPFDHTSMIASVLEWLGIDYRDATRAESYLGERVAHAPTFWPALTRESPRVDDPFERPLPGLGDPVVYGSPIALRNEASGQYITIAAHALAPAAGGKRWFPTLGKKPVTLELREGYGPVTSGSNVQIRSCELQLNGLDTDMARPNNTLGSFRDSTTLYYWFTDAWGTFGAQQLWSIEATHKAAGQALAYGDAVTFSVGTNLVAEPYLAPAGFLNKGYLTTDKRNASATWIIEPPTELARS